MIRTDLQHRDAVARLHGGLAGLQAELTAYERARKGELPTLVNLSGFGAFLVDLRLSAGVSQSELARRLGVDRTQIVRDERQQYRGVTIERAAKILVALGARFESKLVDPLAVDVPASIADRDPIDQLIERLARRWPIVDERLVQLRNGDGGLRTELAMLDVLVADGHAVEPQSNGYVVDGTSAIAAGRSPTGAQAAFNWVARFVEIHMFLAAQWPLTVILDVRRCEDPEYARCGVVMIERLRFKNVTPVMAEDWFASRGRAAPPAY
jgi:transcriptional regulator with XRE-family HTH domain